MKVVILAGGLGTRISEESDFKPKPMINIGNWPILWHILKHYSYYNFNEFIICCGYKGYLIKQFFNDYQLFNSDQTFDFKKNEITVHKKNYENWKVTVVDTGENVETAGRLKRISDYLDENESFCLTYGDGLSNLNLSDLVNYHKSHKKIATLTTVRLPSRFGSILVNEDNLITNFYEKPVHEHNLINGGFFVLSPKIFDYIENDQSIFEVDCLPKLSKDRQLKSFFHKGFWQSMDTLRDQRILNELWSQKKAPWKVWN